MASHCAPTFSGNGLLGVRVPAAGEGYAGGTVKTSSTPSASVLSMVQELTAGG